MSTLEFIAALAAALAWPVAIVTLAAIFRRSIAATFSTFRRFKYGELELTFEKELRGIAGGLPTLSPESQNNAAKADDLTHEAKAVAQVAPKAVIPLAWAAVESEIREAIHRVAKDSLDVPFSTTRKLSHLQHNGAIDDKTAESIEALYKLRNRVMHGDLAISTLSEREALEYASLAGAAVAALRKVK